MSPRIHYGGSEPALSDGGLSLAASPIIDSGTPAAVWLHWGYS